MMTESTEARLKSRRGTRALTAAWLMTDLRALAAMRIGLGLCAVYDLLGRLPVMTVVYGGSVSPLTPLVGTPWTLGLLWGGHPLWLSWVVLLLGLGAAALFSLGRWTRPAQCVLILALLSFQAPHFGVTICGGSTVLRQVLLISLFLPLASRWSWGEWSKPQTEPKPVWQLSWVYFALLVQTAIIYLNTAFSKDGPSWTEGTGLIDVLTLETRVTWLGRLVRPYIDLEVSSTLTQGALVFELVAPILLLLPLANGQFRRWIAGTLIGFHLSIMLMIDVAHFSPVMIAVLLSFMGAPPPDDRLDEETPFRGRGWSVAATLVLLWFCIVPALKSNGFTTSSMRRLGLGHDPITVGLSSILAWEQDWSMFSPSVPRIESLLIVRGLTASGRSIDPLSGEAPHTGLFRDYPSAIYPSFSNRFLRRDGQANAMALRSWLIKRWNDRHTDPLVSAEVVLLEQIVRRPDEGKKTRFKALRLAGP